MNLSGNTSATKSSNELLYVGFNQDSSCFACGVTDGFAVFNVSPFGETFRRIFVSGGIGIVEMLFRCNLLAIVGGGRNPRYPPNKVMIWDDRQNRCVGELLFKTEVYAVRLRRDRVVVVLANKVHVHRFKDLKLLQLITTVDNTLGLVAQSSSAAHNVLAVLGLVPGSVRVELFDLAKFVVINAHQAELAAMALTADGTQLATASSKGTIIRVWDTITGIMLRELRRGTDRAEIYSLAFNPAATYLACSSDKGTIHVFSNVNANGISAASQTTVSPMKTNTPTATRTRTESNNTNANNVFTQFATEQGGDHILTSGPGTGASSTPHANEKGSLAYLQNILPNGTVSKYFSSGKF